MHVNTHMYTHTHHTEKSALPLSHTQQLPQQRLHSESHCTESDLLRPSSLTIIWWGGGILEEWMEILGPCCPH